MICDQSSLQRLRENTDKVSDATCVSGIIKITTEDGTVAQGWNAETKIVHSRERGEWGGRVMLQSQDGREREIDVLDIRTVKPCDYPYP
jgi:hypothetical protein